MLIIINVQADRKGRSLEDWLKDLKTGYDVSISRS
jgi:hypothetical protein